MSKRVCAEGLNSNRDTSLCFLEQTKGSVRIWAETSSPAAEDNWMSTSVIGYLKLQRTFCSLMAGEETKGLQSVAQCKVWRVEEVLIELSK